MKRLMILGVALCALAAADDVKRIASLPAAEASRAITAASPPADGREVPVSVKSMSVGDRATVFGRVTGLQPRKGGNVAIIELIPVEANAEGNTLGSRILAVIGVDIGDEDAERIARSISVSGSTCFATLGGEVKAATVRKSSRDYYVRASLSGGSLE